MEAADLRLIPDFKSMVKAELRKRGQRPSSWRPEALAHRTLDLVTDQLGVRVSRRDRQFPIQRPMDPNRVAILADPEFQRSVEECMNYTILDTARLANLWIQARQTGPGTMVEVGTFRGGAGLHISNANPDRPMYIFDPFDAQSFDTLDPELDRGFVQGQFSDASQEGVERLFEPYPGRDVNVVRGYFPQSAIEAGLDLGLISFAYIDTDTYGSVRGSLNYIVPRLAPRSMIVLDDDGRQAPGVEQAVREVLSANPRLRHDQLFPGQGRIFSLDLI